MEKMITANTAYIISGILYMSAIIALNAFNFFLRKSLKKVSELTEKSLDFYTQQNKRLSDALSLAIDEIPAEKRTSELFDKFEKILCSDEVKL